MNGVHITVELEHGGVPIIRNALGDRMGYPEGVKAVRAALGMTVQELADVCGVSRATVYGWESGRRPETAALNVMRLLVDSKARRARRAR